MTLYPVFKIGLYHFMGKKNYEMSLYSDHLAYQYKNLLEIDEVKNVELTVLLGTFF